MVISSDAPEIHHEGEMTMTTTDLRRRHNAAATTNSSFSEMSESGGGGAIVGVDLSRDCSIGSSMDKLLQENGEQKEKEEEQEAGSITKGGENIGNGGGAAVGETKAKADVKFMYRASAPAHRSVKESPLSSDAIFRQSHAGLFNLCVVVLVAVNSRLIIENLMKYGLLIRAGFWFSSKSLRDWPLFMCCLSLNLLPLGAYTVERLARVKYISDPVVVTLHVIITSTAILYPVLMILSIDSAVQSGITLMLFACIVWLKLVSYAHTSYDMRELSRAVDKDWQIFLKKDSWESKVSSFACNQEIHFLQEILFS